MISKLPSKEEFSPVNRIVRPVTVARINCAHRHCLKQAPNLGNSELGDQLRGSTQDKSFRAWDTIICKL